MSSSTKDFIHKLIESTAASKNAKRKKKKRQEESASTGNRNSIECLPAKSVEEKILELYDSNFDHPNIKEPGGKKKAKFDEFGFIDFGRSNSTSSESECRQLREQKRCKRVGKKLAQLKSRCGTHPEVSAKIRSSKNFKKWAYKGFPLDCRDDIYSSIAACSEECEKQDVYETMLSYGRRHSCFIRQIDADIHRTLRKHCFYSERYSSRQRELLNILVAYSVFNPDVGYCQGLNLITAILLIYIKNELKTFWALHWLIADPLHRHFGFMAPGFPKYQSFEDHFRLVLRTHLNDVFENFELQNVPYSAFLPKWFFLVYLEALPYPQAIRVYDLFLFRGHLVLIPMGVAILKHYRRQLSKLSMENILTFLLDGVPSDIYLDENKLFSGFKGLFKKLKRQNLCLPLYENSLDYFEEENCGKLVFKELERTELDSLEKPPETLERHIVAELPAIEIRQSENSENFEGVENAQEFTKEHTSSLSKASSILSVASEKLPITEKLSDKIPDLFTLKEAKHSLESGIKRTLERPAGLSKVLTRAFNSSRLPNSNLAIEGDSTKQSVTWTASSRDSSVCHHYPDEEFKPVDLFDSMNLILSQENQEESTLSSLPSPHAVQKNLSKNETGLRRSSSDRELKLPKLADLVHFLSFNHLRPVEIHSKQVDTVSAANTSEDQLATQLFAGSFACSDALRIVKNPNFSAVKLHTVLKERKLIVNENVLTNFNSAKNYFLKYTQDVYSAKKFHIPKINTQMSQASCGKPLKAILPELSAKSYDRKVPVEFVEDCEPNQKNLERNEECEMLNCGTETFVTEKSSSIENCENESNSI